jgi:hypothetical protein
LRSVNLWNNGVADKQARAYSGGMKRRLSVAISFVGDPLVVYLDEPSTGLDPASRRNLWDVVKASKAGRGIVLTTHSMEEAETLCDRLGIFVDGRLVCIGNPKEITSRYGGYLVMTLTVAPGQEADARAFVARLSPNARLTYSVGGTLKFELPSDEVRGCARLVVCLLPLLQSYINLSSHHPPTRHTPSLTHNPNTGLAQRRVLGNGGGQGRHGAARAARARLGRGQRHLGGGVHQVCALHRRQVGRVKRQQR